MEMADDLERPCGLFPEERSSAGVNIEFPPRYIGFRPTVRETRFKRFDDAMRRFYPLMGIGLLPDERLLKRMLKVNWTIREYQRCLQMPTKSRGEMSIEFLWLTDEDWKIVDKLFQDLIFGAKTVSTMGDWVVQDRSSRTSRDRSVAAASPGRAAVYDAFVFLTALLLSAVFQYLIGSLDKGGTKVHSSGSSEFRWKDISIVLLLGAYIWIKFRDGAPDSEQKPSPVIRRRLVWNSDKTEKIRKYEPRFKPPRSHGTYISVGSYGSEEDAKNMYLLLAFCYDKYVRGELPLLNGLTYPIPRITEEERRLEPKLRREWAKRKAKDNFAEYKAAFESSRYRFSSDLSEFEEMLTILFPSDCSDASGVDSSRLEAEAQPFRLGNQSDDVDTVTPGMLDISVSDYDVVGEAKGAGVPDEQSLDPQLQHQSLHENQANNVIPDDLSIQRQMIELQHQAQLQQSQIQQLLFLQQDTQSRISELEGEIERLRSTERARKRICTCLNSET